MKVECMECKTPPVGYSRLTSGANTVHGPGRGHFVDNEFIHKRGSSTSNSKLNAPRADLASCFCSPYFFMMPIFPIPTIKSKGIFYERKYFHSRRLLPQQNFH